MELLQLNATDSQTCLETGKQNKHNKQSNFLSQTKSPQYWYTYNQKRQEYLLKKQKERRLKQKLNKPSKPRSLFLQNREQKFINCLDKHHIVVPIPRSLKTKHPIIQGWNKPNWWWKAKIPELLAQGYN